jgi:hypothetical protein
MAARFHRTLKVITFNANGIWRQCYELSIELQDLHILVESTTCSSLLSPQATPGMIQTSLSS